MSFSNPHLLWALVAIPVLLALRWLLPRRRRVATAVLAVWEAAVERVPRRKRTRPSRSDILLAAMLVAFALLTLAAAGLQTGRQRTIPPTVAVLTDVSPSMDAIEPGGTSRRTLAERQIDAIPQVKLTRRRVPDMAWPFDAPVPRRWLTDAAAGQAVGGPVLLVTDQPLADGPNLRVLHVGTPLENLAVAAFAAGDGEVFVRVRRYAKTPGSRQVLVKVFCGKGPQPATRTAARALTVGPDDATAVFPMELKLEDVDWLACRIERPAGEAGPLDPLAWDDVAWLSRRWTERIAVRMVGRPGQWLRRAMADDPRVDWSETDALSPTDDGRVDLLIANEVPPPTAAPWVLQVIAGDAAVPLDARMAVADADAPLVAGVDLAAVRVAKCATLAAGPGATVLATLGGRPAIVLRQIGGQRVVEVGFSLDQANTNWIAQSGFVIFCSRLIEQVRQGRPVAFAEQFGAAAVDSPLPVPPAPPGPAAAGGGPLLMTDPTKPAVPPADASARRLDRVGCWFVPADGRPRPLAAWSPSDAESDLSTAEPLPFDAAAYVAGLPVRREGVLEPLWPWLAGATLLLLAAAWWWLRR